MTAFGLSPQEFWGSVLFLCVVGLIYFGRAILDAEAAAERVKPFKWGDGQRRATNAPLWLSHPMLAAATCLTVLLVLKVAL
jgi:hypothetical protein